MKTDLTVMVYISLSNGIFVVWHIGGVLALCPFLCAWQLAQGKYELIFTARKVLS